MSGEIKVLLCRKWDAALIPQGFHRFGCFYCGGEVGVSPGSLSVVKAESLKPICMECLEVKAEEKKIAGFNGGIENGVVVSPEKAILRLQSSLDRN